MNEKSGLREGNVLPLRGVKKSNLWRGSMPFSQGSKKRGQLTLMIMVAVILVMAIILFFFYFGRNIATDTPPSSAPRATIEKCVSDSVQLSINSVLEYGGVIVPRLAVSYRNHSYNYLCYIDTYYKKCYNYYPMLNRVAEEEIRVNSHDLVGECFSVLLEDYKSRGFDVDEETLDYRVEIVPGSVRLHIKKKIGAIKGGSIIEFEDFDMKVPSDLYELLNIARKVVNSEAKNCYFENNGFMILYPNYNMSRVDHYESKIYEVQNRKTKELLKFAIRSCAYAPGF